MTMAFPVRALLTERLVRYAKVNTQSDPTAFKGDAPLGKPSTPGQLTLLRMIADELGSFVPRFSGAAAGAAPQLTITFDDKGYVYAELAASPGCEDLPAIAFLTHVDSTHEQPGENVIPRVIENYDGTDITYPDNPELVLSPSTSPALLKFVGDTLVVASGKTLLAADDKAGNGVSVTLVDYLTQHPEIKHPKIVLIFSPDEETGHGVKEIDLACVPKYCLTLDGGLPGELESECWNAKAMKLKIKGRGHHPGFAKGKLINALTATSWLLHQLPRDEAPETTEGRQGFYYPVPMNGKDWSTSATEVWIIIRDFEVEGLKRREDFVKQIVDRTKAEFPGLEIEVDPEHQYDNIRLAIEKDPRILDLTRQAIRDVGLEPIEHPIRGGTDGSKLMGKGGGHLAPNLFVGMQNIHSLTEWIAVGAMEQCFLTLVALMKRWVEYPHRN